MNVQQLSTEPRSFTIDQIIAWAWEHKMPDVSYERSFDISGPIYDTLKAKGILPSAGVFAVSEQVVYEVLLECKDKAFGLVPGNMTREQKEKFDADYWRSVEAELREEDERFWDEEFERDFGAPLDDPIDEY